MKQCANGFQGKMTCSQTAEVGGPVIPAALTSGESLLVADRSYQTAAAHFYAGDYDEAANDCS